MTVILHCTKIGVKTAVSNGNEREISPDLYSLRKYIVAIAWLHVTVLMAATEPNPTSANLSLIVYGLAPLSLLRWLIGTPQRRRANARKQRAAETLARKEPH